MGSYLKEYNLRKDSCISESPPEHGGYLWKGEKQRLTAPLKTVQLYSVYPMHLSWFESLPGNSVGFFKAAGLICLDFDLA